MATSKKCPDCGAKIPADSRRQYCKKCYNRRYYYGVYKHLHAPAGTPYVIQEQPALTYSAKVRKT